MERLHKVQPKPIEVCRRRINSEGLWLRRSANSSAQQARIFDGCSGCVKCPSWSSRLEPCRSGRVSPINKLDRGVSYFFVAPLPTRYLAVHGADIIYDPPGGDLLWNWFPARPIGLIFTFEMRAKPIDCHLFRTEQERAKFTFCSVSLLCESARWISDGCNEKHTCDVGELQHML